MQELRHELKSDITKLESKIGKIETRLGSKIDGIATRLEASIRELNNDHSWIKVIASFSAIVFGALIAYLIK